MHDFYDDYLDSLCPACGSTEVAPLGGSDLLVCRDCGEVIDDFDGETEDERQDHNEQRHLDWDY